MTGAVPQMIRRYIRDDYCPDDGSTTYDIQWRDRTTGKIVLSYDGADPANTNPHYGAEPDSDVFAKMGRDLDEEIEINRSVLPVPAGEAQRQLEYKERRAAQAKRLEEQRKEEEEAPDLLDVVGEEIANRITFSSVTYIEEEEEILKPALEAKGFKDITFYMIERDSFGPLIRGCVARDPDGNRKRFTYG